MSSASKMNNANMIQQCNPNILGCIEATDHWVVVVLKHCPVRAPEKMGLVQFGEELTFRGHESSFTASGSGSSRRESSGL